MSDSSGQSKTHEASQHKLRKLKEKGQVSKSVELSNAVGLATGLICVFALAPGFARDFAQLWESALRLGTDANVGSATALVRQSLFQIALSSLAVFAAVALPAVLALWLQIGFVFSFDPLVPKVERINPITNAKQLFSIESVMKLVLMVLRSVVVGLALYLAAAALIADSVRVAVAGKKAALSVFQEATSSMLIWGGIAFIFLGAADFAFQRWNFLRQQKMTRQEVEREARDLEGNAHIKAKRKEMASEPTNQELLAYMNVASIVLVAGDGRVLALYLPQEEDKAAVAIIKGKGPLAIQILSEAERHGVSQRSDTRLVDELWSLASGGHELNRDLTELIRRAM